MHSPTRLHTHVHGIVVLGETAERINDLDEARALGSLPAGD